MESRPFDDTQCRPFDCAQDGQAPLDKLGTGRAGSTGESGWDFYWQEMVRKWYFVVRGSWLGARAPKNEIGLTRCGKRVGIVKWCRRPRKQIKN